MWGIIFNGFVTEGFLEEVTFELMPEWSQEEDT